MSKYARMNPDEPIRHDWLTGARHTREQHDHECYCGTARKTPHKIGEDGCVRTIAPTPLPVSCEDDRWMVEGHNITGYTMREQRGYHRHPCGCWSRSNDSNNSIDA